MNAVLADHGIAEQVGQSSILKLESIAKVRAVILPVTLYHRDFQSHVSSAPSLLGLLPYLRGFECQKYYVQRLFGSVPVVYFKMFTC